MSAPGLIIAAPASGSGKTTVTLALLRALRRAGIAVGSFKVGPDYVDPMFHARASGRPCLESRRLGDADRDPGRARRRSGQGRGAGARRGRDGVVRRRGGRSRLDRRSREPVRSAGRPRGRRPRHGRLGGCSGRRLHAPSRRRRGRRDHLQSGRQRQPMRRCCAGRATTGSRNRCSAACPRTRGCALPERHLGLVPADELPDFDDFLDRAAAIVAEHVDLQRLARLARPVRPRSLRSAGAAAAAARPAHRGRAGSSPSRSPIPPSWRLAHRRRRDPAVLAARRRGARRGRRCGLSAGRLSGAARRPARGQPRLHPRACAPRPSGARRSTANAAASWCWANAWSTARAKAIAMAGLLPIATSFAEPRLHLGYRRIKLLAPSPLGQGGTTYRGHEFHYASQIEAGDAPPLFEITDARQQSLGADRRAHRHGMRLVPPPDRPDQRARRRPGPGRAICAWSITSRRRRLSRP